MVVILILGFGLYFLFILFLLYGWERILSRSEQTVKIHYSMSVIIPFRNEEKNLELLLKSLLSIQYPKEKAEFILVNDHSTDNSVSRLDIQTLSNSKIINLDNYATGKKACITAGIAESTSEIIITTDADCNFTPEWLNSINSKFNEQKVNMVVGSVAIEQDRSFFSKIQAIEFASLIGSGVSLLQWKIPAMANGANLAFRRNVFYDVDGYQGNSHIASGDDEYLLKKFYSYSPSGVIFNNNPESVVKTCPQDSLFDFFQQRIRWAGKWKHQSNIKVKVLALLVFVFQVTFIAAMVNYMITGNKLMVTLLMAKAVIEAIFLFRVCVFVKVRLSLIPFVLLQIIYPFYVVLTAIGSLFLTFEWKGRIY